MNDFDVVIVGAGPAGAACALTLAREGVRVALVERGAYPGAKSLMGGVLYTDVLAQLVPDYLGAGAPLERHVARRGLSVLSAGAETAFSFQTDSWDRPPHNHAHTVLRARFDRWLAGVAEAAGAELLGAVVVDRLLRDPGGQVVGVRARMPEGEDPTGGDLSAGAVVLADGANSLLAEAAGLKAPASSRHMALGIKETLGLDRARIEDRFGLTGDQGVAWEYLGEATGGLKGAGFLYTNRESLSVGVVVYASDLVESGISPVEVLEKFKSHPAVAPRLEGAEPLEYGAHLIPETGYDRLPPLHGDGVLLVGDAAGLLSTSPQHQGANYAMASGVAAARTLLETRQKGDYTATALARYRTHLEEGFVLPEMERYRGWPGFVERNPQVFSRWPDALNEMVEAALRHGGDRGDRDGELWDLFQRRIGVLPFATTAVQLRNALKLFGYGKTDQVLEYLARNW